MRLAILSSLTPLKNQSGDGGTTQASILWILLFGRRGDLRSE